MTIRKLTTAGTTATILAVGLSACGSGHDGPSAAGMVNKAKQNATSARSTSMSVSGSVQGQTVTLDATGTLDGKNQRQRQNASNLSSEEYVVGNTAYFKANSEFLSANGMSPTQSKSMANMWWSKPLTSASQGASVDVKGLLNQFFASADGKKLDSNSADVKKTTTRGQQTYTISDPKKPKGAKLVITRGASPEIVEIQDYASALTQNTQATYTFSQWNKVPDFKAPQGAKSIDKAPKDTSSSPSSSTPSPSSSSGSKTSGSGASAGSN